MIGANSTKFFILSILTSLLISGCIGFLGISESDNQSRNANLANSNPKLENEYENNLKEALEPFWQENKSAGLRDRILELRAPSKYLKLHLDLVLAFDLIEQGQINADQAKIEEGLEKISQLREEYPWLD